MILSNFGERLSELIFDAGLTPAQLNRELNCGSATIHHYISGRHVPSVEMAVRLADYFGCSVDYLLGITEENTTRTFQSCPPFGERLVFLCKYYQVSRYHLQKVTNISESVMRYWINGKTTPSLVNVLKLADAFHCSVDFVLGRES